MNLHPFHRGRVYENAIVTPVQYCHIQHRGGPTTEFNGVFSPSVIIDSRGQELT